MTPPVRAAQDDRARARSAAAAIGGSLDREAAARDAAVRHHTGEVEQQRAWDAVEVPGLSPAALATLKAVQTAGLTAEIPREGERYDARQRRKEELVSAAWREGRADPHVANELDRFMAAASERLGEEGMRNVSRAASRGRSMDRARRRARAPGRAGRAGPQLRAGARRDGTQRGLGSAGRAGGEGGRAAPRAGRGAGTGVR